MNILGHEHAKEVIRAALCCGRVHHAWVFHGPEGVGKFTAAVELAKALLCHDRSANGAEACGECVSCRLLAKPQAARESAHPDLHLIYKELAGDSESRSLREKKQATIPIDLLREAMVGGWVENKSKYVEPVMGRKPMLNHSKVFIIDEAELLADSVNATQNTLLKTLEEPPPATYIILVTSQEDRLLPTIRSRCQRVPFGELPEEIVERWLKERPEGAELTAKQRAWAVRFARGSLGRALLAVQYRLDTWAESIGPMIDRVAAGKPQVDLGAAMAGLVDAFAEAWVKNHKGASKDAANKAGVRHMLGLVAELCRSRLRDAAAKADPADPLAAEDAARPWLAGIDLIQDAERNLESNVNIALLLDNLAIQWSDTSRPLAA